MILLLILYIDESPVLYNYLQKYTYWGSENIN